MIAQLSSFMKVKINQQFVDGLQMVYKPEKIVIFGMIAGFTHRIPSWQSNIAIDNGPFIVDLYIPIKKVI